MKNTRTHILAAAFACMTLGPVISHASLFGVTASDLVILDPSNPALVTTIGSTNLPGLSPISLAYDPTQQMLFGISLDGSQSSFLVTYDRLDGHGTKVANLGSFSLGVWEALEFVDFLSSLTVSHSDKTITNFTTNLILKIDGSGTSAPQTNTTPLDNDAFAYDAGRNLFFVHDSNGTGLLKQVNLQTGVSTTLGSLPSTTQDMAYSATFDAILATDPTTHALYRIDTADGSAPITVNSLGAVGGAGVVGIAFVPTPTAVPEPPSFTLMLIGVALFLRRRKSCKVVSREQTATMYANYCKA